MDKPDPYGEWVISGNRPGKDETSSAAQEELLAAAREVWPRVLAHARREVARKGLRTDKTTLAADVWEAVLRSVSRALKRKTDNQAPIGNLQSYLIAAFHHRLNRVLKREQRRLETIEFVPSTLDLDRMASARDTQWVSELERAITVKQIIGHMDEWTRRVWSGRQYGYSWKEISRRLGLSEQQAKMRFRRGLEKTRGRLIELLRHQNPSSPEGQ